MDWTGDPGSLREALEVLVQLLSPFAPHVAEELWRELGRTEQLTLLHWPDADPALVVDEAYQIAVQVNGKLRGEVQVAASADDAEIRDMAARDPKVAGWLHGKTDKKVVVVPKRLVNFVVA
jgi:leucyl-tRNA synthetase